MKIFYLILLLDVSEIVKVLGVRPPHEVFLRMSSETSDELKINVKLKQTHSFLANKHLPVWVLDGDDQVLKPLKNIMEDIGPFHMYQNNMSCSAAVYFEKEECFDGTIGQRYSLIGALYDPKNNEATITKSNLIRSWKSEHPKIDFDTKSGIFGDVKMPSGEDWHYVESLIENPETVYIETLVIINYDLINVLQPNHNEIVSSVLVTMNSVDMLYSQIHSPRIRINIAGIIMGNSKTSFRLVQENCFKSYKKINVRGFNEECVGYHLRSTLGSFQKTIPIYSYDIVIFITTFQLFYLKKNTKGKVEAFQLEGSSSSPIEDDVYEGYTLSSHDIPIALVKQAEPFTHFPVASHEIAHLFQVDHEVGKFRSASGECIGNLMKSDGQHCEKCLYFGDTARKQMKEFFKSREGCKFRNKPRSLHHPSTPQLFWNEHKQCQCYGFLMAKKPQKIDCEYRRPLECLNGVGEEIETSLFMDGTLCHLDELNTKVCWNGECKKFKH